MKSLYSCPKFDVFLSYAEPDKELASATNLWLQEDFDINPFFAPVALPLHSEDWHGTIRDGLRRSKCFLPILTKHSTQRGWVIFESGAADALNLPFCRVRAANVQISDLRGIPGPDRLVYDLFNVEQLSALAVKIHQHARRRGFSERLVKEKVETSNHAKRVIQLSRKRSIFIAGSLPYDYPNSAELSFGDFEAPIPHKEAIRRVTHEITDRLLKENFYIVSCPEIETVGFAVLERVHHWAKERNLSWKEAFKPGGDYQMEKMPAQLPDSEEDFKDLIRRIAMESRKSYLRGQEWLLILGGKERTGIELAAATDLGDLKICALPFFGGVGLQLWNKLSPDQRIDLPPKLTWSSAACEQVIAFLNGSK